MLECVSDFLKEQAQKWWKGTHQNKMYCIKRSVIYKCKKWILNCNFLVWTAALGKVLTTDNLRKRRLTLLDWCCMCKANGESIDHLFLHCSIARDLWSLVFSIFGVWWVMPCHVLELLLCWSTGFKSYRSAHLWDLITHCVLWVIWREQNAQSFEDTERTAPGLKQFFLNSLFEWVNASGHYHFLSVYELINFCQFSL